jgi:hypothetical protein
MLLETPHIAGLLSPRVALLAIAAVLGACESVETRFIDPPIDIGSVPLAQIIEGNPEIVLLQYADGELVEMTDGVSLEMFKAQQGGWWAHATMDVVGISTPATVQCRLTLVTAAAEVSSTNTLMRLLPNAEGTALRVTGRLPLKALPPAAPEDISSLDGLDADLECTVTDGDGRTDSAVVAIILIRL